MKWILLLTLLTLVSCDKPVTYEFKEEFKEALTSDLYSGSNRCSSLAAVLKKLNENGNKAVSEIEKQVLANKENIIKACSRKAETVPKKKVSVFSPVNEAAKTMVKVSESDFPFFDKKSLRILMIDKGLNIKVNWMPAKK